MNNDLMSPPSGAAFVIASEISTATRRATVVDQSLGGGAYTCFVQWKKDTDDSDGKVSLVTQCTCPEHARKKRCKHTKVLVSTGMTM